MTDKIGNVLQVSFLRCNDAIELISNLAKDSKNVRFSKHARDRMLERDVSDIQVIRCLMSGRFEEEPSRSSKGNWSFKMRVMDSGESITVVGALDYDNRGNHVLVITTYT